MIVYELCKMITTIAITAVMVAIIIYFSFSVGDSGFVGFMPTLPKFCD